MSSTIYYKFYSQKDISRLPFDGTGITVFDLKKDIININALGDGTDFQLKLYNPDGMEEYVDDTQVIPRSSTVIAKRAPATKSIHSNVNTGMRISNATRYVIGKPKIFKKLGTTNNTAATNTTVMNTLLRSGNSNISGNSGPVSEEDRIANMFANQEVQWEQTQKEMSQAVPIFHSKNSSAMQSSHIEAPPPPGYMCYRCGAKDHWIKNCPTNSNPNFEGKRIKRTTGIPKKFLKTVSIDPSTMSNEDIENVNLMITQDGKFVVQMEDDKTWEDYQRKKEQQGRNLDRDGQSHRFGNTGVYRRNYFSELPDDLRCPLTDGLIKDAVVTSQCCKKNVSRKVMEDALLESDFICPLCKKHDIYLDSLEPNEDLRRKVNAYIEEHASNVKSNGENTSTVNGANNVGTNSDSSGNVGNGNQPENNGTNKRKTATTTGTTNVETDSNGSNKKLKMPIVPPVPIPPFVFPMFPLPPFPPTNTLNGHMGNNNGNINNK
ncbi:related to Protein MPE1 [Saccharomycodes ludwigii]|uniref:Related to Protein MPE1 n=1 Tax=Saccharomycodes ludwigii TaxID=36035 RepID=A0A376B108_9ASCO|nr:related to Protein MPE1 [Saccharomycodes ludwigii]